MDQNGSTASEIVWDDEDPDVVETMIDWIYHDTLPKLTTTKLDFNLCPMCYVFAETRIMYGLKNIIVDLLRKDYVQHRCIAEATDVYKAYKLGLDNMQMGKLLLKSTVYKSMGNQINERGKAREDQLVEACEDGDLAKDIVKEIISYRNLRMVRLTKVVAVSTTIMRTAVPVRSEYRGSTGGCLR